MALPCLIGCLDSFAAEYAVGGVDVASKTGVAGLVLCLFLTRHIDTASLPFVSGIHIFIDPLGADGKALFIVALRKFCPQYFANQIFNGCLCFLIIGPVVEFGDLGFDLCQKADRHRFDFLDVLLGQAFGKQHIIEG